MNLIHHANILIICKSNSRIRLQFAKLLSISGWLETGKVQGIRNLRSSGIWSSLESGTTVAVIFMNRSFGRQVKDVASKVRV
jgi:hypothetical protein